MTLRNPSLSKDDENAPAPFITLVVLFGVISLGGLVGLMSPASGETFSRSIDITLLLMIFSLFFELRLGSLYSAFQNIRFLALAWSANFLIVPIIGFGIASLFFSSQPLIFAGLMIYFLAPCTDWFLGFTRLAKGDTELGAALIPINIMTQLLLFPLWLWLLSNGIGFIDISAMPGMLLHWFIFPLVAAQSIRFATERLLPEAQCSTVLSAVGRLIPLVLAGLIFLILATHIREIVVLLDLAPVLAAAVCTFFLATIATGEVLSRLARLDYPQQALLSITMAARNAPLMIALTATAMPNQPLVLAIIVFGMLVEMPLLTTLNQFLLKRRPDW